MYVIIGDSAYFDSVIRDRRLSDYSLKPRVIKGFRFRKNRGLRKGHKSAECILQRLLVNP